MSRGQNFRSADYSAKHPKIRDVRVRMTASQYLKLDALATREDRSLAWVVRRLIERAAKELR